MIEQEDEMAVVNDNQASEKMIGKKRYQIQRERQDGAKAVKDQQKTNDTNATTWSMTMNSRVSSWPPRLDWQNAANNKQNWQLRYRRWTRRNCFLRRFSLIPNATRPQTPTHKAAKRTEELSAPEWAMFIEIIAGGNS